MRAGTKTLVTFAVGFASGVIFAGVVAGALMMWSLIDSERRGIALAETASATIEQWSAEDVEELWHEADACWRKRQGAAGTVPEDEIPGPLRDLGFEVWTSETGLGGRCGGSYFGVAGVQIVFVFKSVGSDVQPSMSYWFSGMGGTYDPVSKTWTFHESDWDRC